MKKIKKRKIISLIIIVFFVIVSIFAFNTDLVVQYYTISTDKVSKNVRIAFIADLHSCYYGENQITLVELINKQKPDIILFGGDIVDDVMPDTNTKILLDNISKLYPCYYVTGNHEYWSGNISNIKKMFKDYGVIVLEGESSKITLNSQKINICGIDDYSVKLKEFTRQLENTRKNRDQSLFTLLLAHRPEEIDRYLKYDYDLILSGHAHGGQWRIPFLLNGLIAPNQGLFPKYAGGDFYFDNTAFIISRGLAKETTIVPRIFNPPELVIIDIAPKN